jgi:hypothetical protein
MIPPSVNFGRYVVDELYILDSKYMKGGLAMKKLGMLGQLLGV